MANNRSAKSCELLMSGANGNLSKRIRFDSINAAVSYAKHCDLYMYYTVYDMTGTAIRRGRCNMLSENKG